MKIPPELKQIRIDVGLAGEAPNSALWLSQTTDRFVIGIEPLPYHWGMIRNFETSNTKRPYPSYIPLLQLEENVVKLNKQVICDVGNRFLGIEAAIDNIKGVQKKKFYMMDRTDGASGSSSLLRPSDKHPHFIEQEVEVTTHSLEHVLDSVDWDRFPYIEHIKTDCEGKDFDVVKSIGKYLDKVAFISPELGSVGRNPSNGEILFCPHQNLSHWHGTHNPTEFIKFMSDAGFSITANASGELVFYNLSLKAQMKNKNLDFATLGA